MNDHKLNTLYLGQEFFYSPGYYKYPRSYLIFTLVTAPFLFPKADHLPNR